MRALTALLVVAIASVADAKSQGAIRPSSTEPASLDVIEILAPDQGVKVTRVDLGLWVQQTRIVATLELDLVGPDATMRDVAIPLRLPPGSRAIGMEVAIDGITTPATLLAANEAKAFYEQTVASYKDPALLEGSGRVFKLRAFPITKQAGHVKLTILMPRTNRVSVVPVRHAIRRLDVDVIVDGRSKRHDSFLDVTTARRIELADPAPGPTEDPALDPKAVDATHSLVAGRTAIGGALPTITIHHPIRHRTQRDLDKAIIRRQIKLQHARLSYCYERELLRDNTLDGMINIKFVIEGTGKVTVLETTGTLNDDTVRSCVAKVFEGMQYPEFDGRIIVNYPVHYRLAGQ